MRVVLAGGGTAGHIEPALALADALRQADSSIEVTCLGTERGLETRLVPLRGYELALIPAVPLPRSVTPKLLTVPGRLAGAVHAAGKVLDRVHADVLVGFGGYVATPAYLAAKRHNVPIVVHEANPQPGIANRLGSHLTSYVYTGYPETKLRNAKYLGLPIRRQIAELDRFALGDKARAHFGLRPDLPVLLVTGGSQGAKSLNRALAGSVAAIRNAGVQVLHVTGPKNGDDIQAAPGNVPYVAVPYVDRMDLAYAAADFALCRAGAMTCAELTAVGLPAVYVPLPIGNGEQRLNALPIVQRGGGLLVDDAELTADWIKSSLLPVLTNIDQVAAMSEAAASLGRRDADRQLAAAVIEIMVAERATREAAAPGRATAGGPGGGQRPHPTAYEQQQARQQPQAPQGYQNQGNQDWPQSPAGPQSPARPPQGYQDQDWPQSPARPPQGYQDQGWPQPPRSQQYPEPPQSRQFPRQQPPQQSAAPGGEPLGSLFTPYATRQSQAAGGSQAAGRGGQQPRPYPQADQLPGPAARPADQYRAGRDQARGQTGQPGQPGQPGQAGGRHRQAR
jgi:UDP-N-acetylglucosamine--N-acetylmuramyl-(pentapeptide) pyrophosphoryl-undecaprenol N-acetylglucosamine transferase